MSQISKCPKLRVVLGYWEALGEVSEMRYNNLLYSSSKRSYCITCSSIVFRLRALEPDVHFLILTLKLHFHVVYIIFHVVYIIFHVVYIIIKDFVVVHIIIQDFFLQESETLSKEMKLAIL